MARKPKKEEHVNHERWLVSYADFITLLFAFFTALYAISTVDAKKAGKMVFSTRQAFNMEFFPTDQPTLGSSTLDPADTGTIRGPKEKVVERAKRQPPKIQPTLQVQGLRKLQSVLDDMRELIRVDHLKGVTVRSARNNVVISLKDAAFFEPGGVKIRRASLPELDRIAEKLLETQLDVRVEGHTDDTPPTGHGHRTNWEISTQRAVSVVRYFIEQFAFPPESLSVAGYASYRPVAGEDTEAGRASNRRVDIVLLQPQPPPPPPRAEEGSPEGEAAAPTPEPAANAEAPAPAAPSAAPAPAAPTGAAPSAGTPP